MSAGVAERPLDGCDLSIGGWTGSSVGGFWPVLLAQAVAAELQAVGVVNNAIEDGVGEPTLADAILDRIIHNAHRLQLSGDSLRKEKTPKPVTA